MLQEVVKSLDDIGQDDDGKAISTIAWILQKFDNTNPDNLLAFLAIDAFERLSGSGGINQNVIQILMRIADGPYIRSVQEKAKTALKTIRTGSKQ